MVEAGSQIPQTPEVAERRYVGAQGYNLSSAGSLFTEEAPFYLTNELNKGKPPELHIGIEEIATRHRGFFVPLAWPVEQAMRKKLITPEITAEKIWQWQHGQDAPYPNTHIDAVQGPYHYNYRDAAHRITLGERGNGIMEHGYQVGWLVDYGIARDMHAVNLAQALRSQGQEVKLIFYPNVIAGFAKDGRLGEVKQRAGVLVVGNERRVTSPLVPSEVMYDPRRIVSDIVDIHPEVDGILFGNDHGSQPGIPDFGALLDLDAIKNTVHNIHLADTNKYIEHDSIQVGDEATRAFLEKVAKTEFTHPVRIALDYNPYKFGKLPIQDQLALLQATFDWMRRIQEGDGNTEPKILKFNRPAQKSGTIYSQTAVA